MANIKTVNKKIPRKGEHLPEGQYLHNRRLLTCEEDSSRLSLPERQDKRSIRKSCLSGSIILQFPCRWSSTIGYENYVLSGRQDSDQWRATSFKNLSGLKKSESGIMKKIILLLLLVSVCAANLQAQKKTFMRDYTYQASEADSKLTARANATTQMRTILLRELGEYIRAEQRLVQDEHSQEYSEKIEAITAGIVEMKTLDDQWNGVTYYIRAEMAVDPKDLERRIADVLNDRQKTKDLEEARKRTLAAEAEADRLKKELAEIKDEQQRFALQTQYRQAADALSAEEYFTKGYNAQQNGFNELAIEYYQQAIAIDPNHAGAYGSMGIACYSLKNYDEAIRCYQKAIAIDPNYAFAYVNLGYVYGVLKKKKEQIKYYQQAARLGDSDAQTQLRKLRKKW
ncbi:MAG: tetratricopeptide repeat protein [Prevotellaceae bacterium]|jgi:tetratricopeptide (TPR) repeat protein|nr:tetratricopeptide repeat protein [Prevotellaceae bacterium]